ncbi:MAG: glycosyltransferase [Flavobacteriales bacterium]|nr:glycosyltransferase [Flavobacteriales bacterium]
MKVAIVHDWLVVNGGAEKVLRSLIDVFDGDVFALIDVLNATDRGSILKGGRAGTTFLQRLPGIRRHYRYFLPLFPTAIESLDLSAYDLVISSSYAVAKGVRTRSGQTHICYIHTPMRYAWDLEETYLQDHGMGSGIKRWVAKQLLDRLRSWDLGTNKGVDHFIANSRNVAARVKKHYGRHADVLLPPVDTEQFALYEGPRDHFVTVSRLVPYKRVDRMIDAFRQMPEETLLVCGDGPERERLSQDLPSNVVILGHVPQDELVDHLQRAHALIAAAEEDLGITPLESLSCGTPVIALAKGGYLETVTDGRTGVLFKEPTVEALVGAVQRFRAGRDAFVPEQLRASALPYDKRRFAEQVKHIVDRIHGAQN